MHGFCLYRDTSGKTELTRTHNIIRGKLLFDLFEFPDTSSAPFKRYHGNPEI